LPYQRHAYFDAAALFSINIFAIITLLFAMAAMLFTMMLSPLMMLRVLRACFHV